MKSMKLHTWKPAVSKLLVALMLVMSVAVITPAKADAASKPALNKTTVTLFEGKQYDLNIAHKIKKSTYTWSTSNKKVAKVTNKGLVTAVSKGTATITCKVKAPKKKTYTLKSKVTVIKPAKLIKINNKVSTLTVGQEYDLNRTLIPSISNEKTYWTTSDAAIASPDKYGKFKALKEGSVTITASTKSGATDSVTIKIVDANGTVSNQSELNALLGSGAAKITLKTTDAANIVIAAGDYSKQSLVVDAPNADVTNNGKFASVEIKAIKSSTWYENAVGNLLNVLAKNARIVVGTKASASIEVNEEGATLTIVNNGEVKKITVSKQAAIAISGDSKESVPVQVDVPNVKITTSVPLSLDCNAKIDLVINKGAEATKVHVTKESDIPTVTGDAKITVTIGSGDTAITKVITGTTTNNGGNAGGSTGGNTNPTPAPAKLTFDVAIDKISSVSVSYGSGKTVTADGVVLLAVQTALKNDLVWDLMKDKDTQDINGVKVTFNKVDETKKTVSITGGKFDGKTYTVTKNSALSYTIADSNGNWVKLTKDADDKNFTVETPVTVDAAVSSKTASKLLDTVHSVTVVYNGKSYTADVPELVTIQKYIAKEPLVLLGWDAFKVTNKNVDGNIISVSEGKTKTITVTCGQPATTKVFTATLNSMNSLTITNAANNVSATITKEDNKVSVTLN